MLKLNKNCATCSDLFQVDGSSQVVFCNGAIGLPIDFYKDKTELWEYFKKNNPTIKCPIKKNSLNKKESIDKKKFHPLSKNSKYFKHKRLYIYPTYRCNNSCIFCYLGKNKPSSEPTFKELSKCVCQAKKQETIIIVGGEPTLYNKLPQLIRILKNKGKKIGLVSNGKNLANKLLVNTLIKVGMDAFTISIHTHLEKDHRLITGQSTLGDVEKGIKNLVLAQEKGRIRSLKISIVINKINFLYLKELAVFLVKKGVKEIRLNNLCLNKKNQFNKNSFLIDPYLITPQLEKCLDYLNDHRIHWIIDGFPLCYLNKKFWPGLNNERFSLQRSNHQKEPSTFLTSLSPKCLDCSLKKDCPGLYYETLAYFGGNNLTPFS